MGKRAQGKSGFTGPTALPRDPPPLPPEDSYETAYRCDEIEVRPGPVPQKLREAAQAAGLTFKPELPDVFKHAVHRQGGQHGKVADKLMRNACVDLVKKGVRFGSGAFDPEGEDDAEEAEEKKLVLRPYTDQELRQAFTCYDLHNTDYVDGGELRHIFAQLGEMPTDNEIQAMILLCDPRGEGTVNFDDFLNIFGNPSDSLRTANVKGIKHLLPRKKIDFDIRDQLGLQLEEKTKLRDTSLWVVEVRKGGQAQDAGVKNGWKVISLENKPMTSLKEFESMITALEKAANLDEDEDVALAALAKAKAKGKGKKEEATKPKVKYDYSIIFAVLEGDSGSEEEEELLEEEDEEDDEEEDEEDD